MVIFEALKSLVQYIFDIRWYEIPKNILFLGLLIGMSYCAALIVISFPVSVWEHFAKKKARKDIESKVIAVVTACFSIGALLLLFM